MEMRRKHHLYFSRIVSKYCTATHFLICFLAYHTCIPRLTKWVEILPDRPGWDVPRLPRFHCTTIWHPNSQKKLLTAINLTPIILHPLGLATTLQAMQWLPVERSQLRREERLLFQVEVSKWLDYLSRQLWLRLHVTGHSLGASVAMFAAYNISFWTGCLWWLLVVSSRVKWQNRTYWCTPEPMDERALPPQSNSTTQSCHCERSPRPPILYTFGQPRVEPSAVRSHHCTPRGGVCLDSRKIWRKPDLRDFAVSQFDHFCISSLTSFFNTGFIQIYHVSTVGKVQSGRYRRYMKIHEACYFNVSLSSAEFVSKSSNGAFARMVVQGLSGGFLWNSLLAKEFWVSQLLL